MGTLSPAIGELSALKKLFLNVFEFSGSIPTEIGNLAELEHLTLRQEFNSSTGLIGEIPASIGNLIKLSGLI